MRKKGNEKTFERRNTTDAKERPYNVLKSDIKKGTGRTGRVISQIKQN